MRCDEAQENISAYLDNELPADVMDALRAHVDGCADCRRLMEEVRATVGLLAGLPARSAPDHLAEDVQREIERRAILSTAPPVPDRVPERTLALRQARMWPRVAALAATVVLAVGIGVFAWLAQGHKPDAGLGIASPALHEGTIVADAERLGDRGYAADRGEGLLRKDRDNAGHAVERESAALDRAKDARDQYADLGANKRTSGPSATPLASELKRLTDGASQEQLEVASAEKMRAGHEMSTPLVAPATPAAPLSYGLPATKDVGHDTVRGGAAGGGRGARGGRAGDAIVGGGGAGGIGGDTGGIALNGGQVGADDIYLKDSSGTAGAAAPDARKAGGLACSPEKPADDKNQPAGVELTAAQATDGIELTVAKGTARGRGGATSNDESAKTSGAKKAEVGSAAKSDSLEEVAAALPAPALSPSPASAPAAAPAAAARGPAATAPQAPAGPANIAGTVATTNINTFTGATTAGAGTLSGGATDEQKALPPAPPAKEGTALGIKPPGVVEEVVAPAERPAATQPADQPTTEAKGLAGANSMSGGMGGLRGTAAPVQPAVAPAMPPASAPAPAPSVAGAPAGPSAAAGPKALEAAMVSVANGYATARDLQAVATRDSLGRVENQLVVLADSRDAGDKEIQRLFAANGWQQTDKAAPPAPAKPAGGAPAPSGARSGTAAADATFESQPVPLDQKAKQGAADRQRAGQSADTLPAPGVYYRTSQGGEDAWVVVADRRSLAAFNDDLVRNGRLMIAGDSSGEFHKLAIAQVAARRSDAETAQVRPQPAGDAKRAAEEGGTAKTPAPSAPPPVGTPPGKTEAESGWKVAEPAAQSADKSAATAAPRKAPVQAQQFVPQNEAADRVLMVIRIRAVGADAAGKK